MKRKLIAAIGVAGMMVGAVACGKDDSGKGGSTDAGGDKTLTVWVMDGSAPDAWIQEVNKDFEAKHKGVKVNVEVQQWNGIQEKVTTALSEDTLRTSWSSATRRPPATPSRAASPTSPRTRRSSATTAGTRACWPPASSTASCTPPLVRRQPRGHLRQGPLRQGRRDPAEDA